MWSAFIANSFHIGVIVTVLCLFFVPCQNLSFWKSKNEFFSQILLPSILHVCRTRILFVHRKNILIGGLKNKSKDA